MSCLEKFEKLYEDEIKIKSLPFEVLRQRLLKKQKFLKAIALFLLFSAPIGLIMLGIFPSFYNFLSGSRITILLFVFPLLGCIFLGFSAKCSSDYEKALKKSLLPIVLQIFENLKYLKSKKIISDEEIIAAGFLNACYTTRSTEDAFIGEYKGYNFKICEDIFRNCRSRKYRVVHRFINISIQHIQGEEKGYMQDDTYKEVVKRKIIKIILEILIVALIFSISFFFSLQSFAENKSYMSIFLGNFPCILIWLITWYDNGGFVNIFGNIFGNFYKKFENNNQQKSQMETNLMNILSCTSLGYAPRIGYVGNSIMLNVKFVEDEKLFELGNINEPLTNSKSFERFIKQIMLVYRFIDFIKKYENG